MHASGSGRCIGQMQRVGQCGVYHPRRTTVNAHQAGQVRPSVRACAAKLPKWDECFRYLVDEKKLRSVTPEEAEKSVESGSWVLVDVRPAPAYQQAHPAGAVSIPLYQPIDWSKPDAGKVFKALAYAFNGVAAVEPNPQFSERVREVTQGGKVGVITLCEAGGTLKPSTNFPFGKASRSLQAAYRVLAEGVTTKVQHLERGVYGWYQADLDFEGEGSYKPEIGRTPSAAAEPTIEAIRSSTGYQMRAGDKK
ncbi:rhodanese-like protein [Haematococcus lacustris]